MSTDKAAPKEYLRLVINALKLAQEGDAEAIAQLKPHAVAAVAGELLPWGQVLSRARDLLVGRVLARVSS